MTDFDELRGQLKILTDDENQLTGNEAESIVARILSPLLAAEGYGVTAAARGSGGDFIAVPSVVGAAPARLVIEYKHAGRGVSPLGRRMLDQVLAHIRRASASRGLVIARQGFSPDAVALAEHELPTSVELMTLGQLGDWLERVASRVPSQLETVHSIVRQFARKLALVVARQPAALMDIEWRDLERLVAEVLAGLGFSVTLTPPSKDGGKDVIANCQIDGATHSYIIELKHWRSGKSVGAAAVVDFVEVVAREKRQGGVFLSTSGFTADAFTSLTEIERQRVRFGTENKLLTLARQYERCTSGIWQPPPLPELLFESTE